MHEQLNMFEETPEKTCFDCNEFFPALIDGPTADGICLRDEAFEPFIEELLEHQNYDCCLELVKEKKFDGNREACPHFEEAEIERYEFDEETTFGKSLLAAMERVESSDKSFEELFLEEQLKRIDYKTLPVEHHLPDLAGNDKGKRDAAVRSLSGLAILGNEGAFSHLLTFLRELPAIKSIEDVHLRLGIIDSLNRDEYKARMVPFLLDQLEHTPSNNTTRQWISAILRYFRSVPLDEIREPLEAMMKKGCFSYRLKKRVREFIQDYDYEEIDWMRSEFQPDNETRR